MRSESTSGPQPVVAVLEGGDPVVVANSEGSAPRRPSSRSRNGEVLVGQPPRPGGDQRRPDDPFGQATGHRLVR